LESCISIEKAVEAKTERFRPRFVNLTNFKKQSPRDDKILKQNDRWVNIELENTKEEREAQMNTSRHGGMKKQLSPMHLF